MSIPSKVQMQDMSISALSTIACSIAHERDKQIMNFNEFVRLDAQYHDVMTEIMHRD